MRFKLFLLMVLGCLRIVSLSACSSGSGSSSSSGSSGSSTDSYGTLRIDCTYAGCLKVCKVSIDGNDTISIDKGNYITRAVTKGDHDITGHILIVCNGATANKYPIIDTVFVAKGTLVTLQY